MTEEQLSKLVTECVGRELKDALSTIDYKVDAAIGRRLPFTTNDRVLFAWRVLREGGYGSEHPIYKAAEAIVAGAPWKSKADFMSWGLQPWICPRCQTVHAGWVPSCGCKITITQTTNTPVPTCTCPAQPIPHPRAYGCRDSWST